MVACFNRAERDETRRWFVPVKIGSVGSEIWLLMVVFLFPGWFWTVQNRINETQTEMSDAVMKAQEERSKFYHVVETTANEFVNKGKEWRGQLETARSSLQQASTASLEKSNPHCPLISQASSLYLTNIDVFLCVCVCVCVLQAADASRKHPRCALR